MAIRAYKTAREAVEVWFKEYKPKTRSMSVKQTDKDDLEDALAEFGTRKNFIIINSLGSVALWRYENKVVGAWQENIEVYYRDASDNAKASIENYLVGAFAYHQAKPYSWKKCTATDIEDMENNTYKITIEVI